MLCSECSVHTSATQNFTFLVRCFCSLCLSPSLAHCAGLHFSLIRFSILYFFVKQTNRTLDQRQFPFVCVVVVEVVERFSIVAYSHCVYPVLHSASPKIRKKHLSFVFVALSLSHFTHFYCFRLLSLSISFIHSFIVIH